MPTKSKKKPKKIKQSLKDVRKRLDVNVSASTVGFQDQHGHKERHAMHLPPIQKGDIRLGMKPNLHPWEAEPKPRKEAVSYLDKDYRPFGNKLPDIYDANGYAAHSMGKIIPRPQIIVRGTVDFDKPIFGLPPIRRQCANFHLDPPEMPHRSPTHMAPMNDQSKAMFPSSPDVPFTDLRDTPCLYMSSESSGSLYRPLSSPMAVAEKQSAILLAGTPEVPHSLPYLQVARQYSTVLSMSTLDVISQTAYSPHPPTSPKPDSPAFLITGHKMQWRKSTNRQNVLKVTRKSHWETNIKNVML